MQTITREFSFSSAHRIEGHPKCGRLHGHNYLMHVQVTGPVAPDGMIMDFKDLDTLVKQVVDQLDHRYIVSLSNIMADDPYYITAREVREGDIACLPVQASTAECLAQWLAETIGARVKQFGLELASIDLWETDKSCATWIKEPNVSD